MSTRRHADDCAKTKALEMWERCPKGARPVYVQARIDGEWHLVPLPEGVNTMADYVAQVECTCDAGCEPSLEERLLEARYEAEVLRDEADQRRGHGRTVLPWERRA